MRKTLIITLWDNKNIGNRLQNYALSRVLSQIDATGYFVSFHKADSCIYAAKKAVKNIQNILMHRNTALALKNRYKRIETFTKEYTKDRLIDIGTDLRNINKIDLNQFDYAISGSDQVWHGWDLGSYEFPFFYLQFMPTEKRISYAASFGYEELPESDIDKHKDGLNGMKNISCREKSGSDIVYKLTGEKPPVVLDPTMCLTSNDWETMMEAPDFDCSDPFICTYFLSGTGEDENELVNNIAARNRYKVIPIMDKNYRNYSSIGPKEFLWLIAHSQGVITNSFHGSVFSIIFNRPLYVFQRSNNAKSMIGRINTLLSTFEMEDAMISDPNGVMSFPTFDFEKVNEIIGKKRKESISYLENAMK